MLVRYLLIFPLLLLAYNLQADDNDLDQLLNEVTELATKSKINIDYTPGIISIISGDELREMGISYLEPNVMDLFPGFSYGKSRASTDFTKYIFMINSMVINTELTGVNVFPRLNTKVIKRIELIRGPSSALYGGNAFSAIINIVTKDEGNMIWLDPAAYSNTHKTTNAGGIFNLEEGELKLGGRFQYNKTDGPDQIITQDAGSLSGEKTIIPSKLDNSMDNYDLGFNLAYQDFTLTYARQHYAFSEAYGMSDAYLPLKREDNAMVETQNLLELSYSFTLKQWQLETKFGSMQYRLLANDAYIAPLESSDFLIDMHFKERNFYSQIEATRSINQHHLLLGTRTFHSKLYHAEYGSSLDLETGASYASPINIAGAFPKVNRKIHSLWAQEHYVFNDNLSLIANLRYDTISDLNKDALSPRLAFIYQSNEQHIVKVQYAQGFRIPVYFFLYGDGSKSILEGYPGLGLDRSHNYEMSYIYKQTNQSIKSTLYHTNMYKVHGYSQEGMVVVEYNNSIQTSGLELEYLKKFKSLSIKANLAYNFHTKRKYLGSTLYEGKISPFPKLLANLILTAPLSSNISCSLWYHYKGPVSQYKMDTQYPGNHIINLAFSYTPKSLQEHLKITLSITDLLNQKYNRPPYPNSYKEEELITNQQKIGLQLSYEF